MKTLTPITLAFLSIFILIAARPVDSWAGSPQSHRWEGVAIGVGAAIIGSALIKACQNSQQAAYDPYPVSARPHRRPPVPSGYWESRPVWVPPIYEKRWNPGHYNRHGRWVQGRWIQIETEPGYWTEQKVWVPAE